MSHSASSTADSINSMEAFLANEFQESQCNMCNQKFYKESAFVLHNHTHWIEQQQIAKSRIFQCDECGLNFKNKTLQNKHIEQLHSNMDKQENTIDAQPIETHNALRSFKCHDCNSAFRTHGVLSKHLRSKNHVRNLVNLGKLPEGINFKIKK